MFSPHHCISHWEVQTSKSLVACLPAYNKRRKVVGAREGEFTSHQVNNAWRFNLSFRIECIQRILSFDVDGFVPVERICSECFNMAG